jgi:hypothetical protein
MMEVAMSRALQIFCLVCVSLHAQVIDFESNGYRYKTMTKNGLTIMFAALPAQVREYSILQVAVSNGSKIPYSLKPEDFVFYREDGSVLPGSPTRSVINELIQKASRHDVIKLVTAYENGLYGNTQYKSTNGYEVRRQNALAETAKIKAAAAASAIAFVPTKLLPGQSTDGAVFYATAGKPIGSGKQIVRDADMTFEFPVVSSN